MPKISFLESYVPLTKTFHKLADGSITKEPYPLVGTFTSHSYSITTLQELYKHIVTHSAKGHCLLKGSLTQELSNETRKGTTRTDAETEWICLDFDRYVSDDVQAELDKFGIGDTSYIIQWSASHGMPGTEGTLSCHIFMLLDKPMRAPELKLWLQSLNFKHADDKIRLSRNHAALCWPLDVTTCQNDKLLYVAPPTFIGLKDPMNDKRIEFIKGKHAKLATSKLGQDSPEAIKQKAQEIKNRLRKAIGLKSTTAGIVFVGEHEVQNKPGEAIVTGIKDCGEYIRLNLNNGDSWAYWHHKTNFELLFNFKGEPAYRLKEIIPTYYADLVKDTMARNGTPSASGDRVLMFRDFQTSQYYNGTYNEGTGQLKLAVARSETQCEHFMMNHGLTYVPPIPIWYMEYSPQENFVVDLDANRINLFKPSSYMLKTDTRKIDLEDDCPQIHKVLLHMVGNDKKVLKEFINWFSCLFNRTGKPRTAWVFHGIEGTGKGTFFECIATPLLGTSNVFYANISTIEDRYNDWMMNKLLIFVDEIDYDDFKEKGRASAVFRSAITDSVFPVRAMRVAPYQGTNHFGIVFASNKKQPVYIPTTDRRYNVGLFQRHKVEMSDEIKALISAELEDFACYLRSMESDVTRASQIFETEDRLKMQALAVTSLQETANAIINADFDSLWASMPDRLHLSEINTMTAHMAYASAFATLMENIAKDIVTTGGKIWNRLSRDELRTIFQYCVGNTPETPNKFTSLLRHVGIETKRTRRNESHRFYGVELPIWKVSDELLSILVEQFGGSPKLRKIK